MGNKKSKGKDSKKQSYGSFQDLFKAMGGETEEPVEEKSPGWTFKRAGEEEEIDLELLPEVNTNKRPQAFGPMSHGPAPYKNIKSEEMQLLKSFRLRTFFPEDVQEEMRALPQDPSPDDFDSRWDLRDQLIFTIDGDDAKDYDDAISIDELENGNFELGVHIADVSHYVVPGTKLDDEASERGTSVYVADQVIPMLPEEISNHLCSLVPDRNRLAFSAFMEFTPKGQRVDYRLGKSVICSKKRCTYRIVQELLDGVKSEETAELEFLSAKLHMLMQWTRTQQSIRDRAGSLRMQSTEQKFVFNEKHEVTGVVNATNYFSQTLIEETALAANQAVGDYFRQRGLPIIYRVHPEKDPDEIAGVIALLERYKVTVPSKERLTGRDIGDLIRRVRNRANSEALVQRIMGLVERADYQVKDHEDVAKHWGLAREAYLHFTSPIRRYPDLIVHRWLHQILTRPEEAEAELKAGALIDDLRAKASHSTMQSSVAQMIERAVFDLKVCQYMDSHIGESHDAKCIRISRGGIELKLTEFNVLGFLGFKNLGGRVQMDGSRATVVTRKRHYSFEEGGALRVKISDVDFVRLKVMFEIAD